MSFRLLNNNRRFREAYCLHLQGLTLFLYWYTRSWRTYSPSKHR